MKKINITTGAFLVYLIALAIYGWPGRGNPNMSYGEFWAIFGVSLVLILLLRIVQVKRFKGRQKQDEEDQK